jgi:outer membrane lipoprotein-sorting protein
MNRDAFRFLRATLWTAPLLFFLVACASSAPVSKDVSVDSLMEEAERKSRLVRQFRAEFVKTRRTSVFNRDVTARGNLVFQKPNSFRLALSGDVNVEILSDGKLISLTHDGADQEIFRVHGERDLLRFSDPLMLLLQNIGDGGLRRFAIVKNVSDRDATLLELEPVNDNKFERIKSVALRITNSGEINRVGILFKDGAMDETVFKSWSVLTANDPEILLLNNKLDRLAKQGSNGSTRFYSDATQTQVAASPRTLAGKSSDEDVEWSYLRSGR